MTPANRLRGEVDLVLAGMSLRLRPSFERLVAAEAAIGSLMALLDDAVAGAVRLEQLEGLFWHCLEPAATDRAAFRERLMATGLAALLPPYRTLLAEVFRGGE